MAARGVKRRRVASPEMEGFAPTPSLSVSADDSGSDSGNVEREQHDVAARENVKRAPIPNARRRLPEGGLAMTGATLKSTYFRLQVDELLSTVRPNRERQKSAFEATLRRLKEIITQIPNRPPMSAAEAEKDLQKRAKIAIPFPQPRPGKDAKYTFEFVKPSNVNVVGSFAVGTGTKTKDLVNIDVAVTMPKSSFQEKDYLNYRYFHKRAYYVACIAAGIIAEKEPFRLTFAYQNDCVLQPILLIEPPEGSRSARCQIRVIIATSVDTFPFGKTLPSKNNIRQPPDAQDPSNATPLYNATLRSEACVASYLKFVHTASTGCDSYADSCVLGRTWLRQRGFDTGISKGGFGPFEWSSLCAALLQGGGVGGRPLLSPGYSSYQMFKAMLHFLATRDLTRPFLWKADAVDLPHSSSPVFYDGVRNLNLLYKMTPWSYQRLRFDAKLTAAMLNDPKFDHFTSTFILKADDALLRFDFLLRLPYRRAEGHESITSFQNRLYEILSTGLGNRTSLVNLSTEETSAWSIHSPGPAVKTDPFILVGLILDPVNSKRAVDHGPPAEDREASVKFQNFWGEKAELRRFTDGSILESLVWATDIRGPSITEQILTCILERHVGETIMDASHLFELRQDHPVLVESNIEESIAGFEPYMTAFQQLERQIHDVEGLPLSLKQLSPADPALRYASCQIGGAVRNVRPADILVEFEGSARWPEDLGATQQTKIAFLLKIGELLKSSTRGVVTRVGIENRDQDLSNKAYLDIIYPADIAFRLRIHHDREQAHLERLLKERSTAPRRREDAVQALAAYKRSYVQSPRHTLAMRTLCTRFPLLSPSMRLFKRWCSAQLLTNHLAEELLELLVVRVFVNPYPWDAPSSTRTGFLRTLHMLSHWDWARDPLVVDVNGSMSVEDIATINTRFEAWRKIDPAFNSVALFVAPNYDLGGVTWTQHRPAKMVACRLIALAAAATTLIRESGLELDMQDLFASDLGEYDFVIHLAGRYIGTGEARKQPEFKNLMAQSVREPDLAGYDPVGLFLRELERVFGDSIVWFYGGNGSSTLAGLWNPQMASKPFRLKLAYSSVPLGGDAPPASGGDALVTINKPAILSEIASLGGDVIKKIQINRA